MCVRDLALLYYRLLCCGTANARHLLQGRRSDPSLGVLIGCPVEPISQWADSFNTLGPLMHGAAETATPSRGQSYHAGFDSQPVSDLPASLDCDQEDVAHPGETISES